MYNILSYFQNSNTCKTQASKSDNSYEYTKRDNVTIFFNNTVASLSKSWRELKEQAFGMSYDIGVGLCAVGNKLKEKCNAITQAMHGFLCNFYSETEEKIEELEMKKLNHEYKQFKTPPIHPEARKISDAHSSDQVVITQHISQGHQQG